MYAERKALLSNIEEHFKAKALLYVTSDRQNLETQISGDVFDHFVNHLDRIGVVDRIVLIIYSRGGDTLAAWSLINLIRQYCDYLVVLAPSRAHSAATLISLGANEIVMTKQATLGPIDPSVNGPLNPQIPGRPNERAPVSVEAINGFLELAHEQNINDSNEMMQMLLQLSQQVHPLVLGNVYRTRSQIQMLAKKLIINQVQDEEHI
jgi:ClpP class serine protease